MEKSQPRSTTPEKPRYLGRRTAGIVIAAGLVFAAPGCGEDTSDSSGASEPDTFDGFHGDDTIHFGDDHGNTDHFNGDDTVHENLTSPDGDVIDIVVDVRDRFGNPIPTSNPAEDQNNNGCLDRVSTVSAESQTISIDPATTTIPDAPAENFCRT